jgi:hypothetical protein
VTTPAPEGAHDLRGAVEVGLWATNRHLTYGGVSASDSPPLRTFDASAVLVPNVRAEVYPAAFGGSVRSIWNGIGLYADYGRSILLKVKPPSDVGGSNRSATLTRLGVGAKWRFEPFSATRFSVTPALGYRSLSLTTGGAEIPGLPDTKLSGFEGRVDVGYGATARVTILAGGGYQYFTSAKDLVKELFPKGSARGLQLEGGVDVRVLGPLSVRALLEYERVSYTLERTADQGTGGFHATSATDALLGVRINARAEF